MNLHTRILRLRQPLPLGPRAQIPHRREGAGVRGPPTHSSECGVHGGRLAPHTHRPPRGGGGVGAPVEHTGGDARSLPLHRAARARVRRCHRVQGSGGGCVREEGGGKLLRAVVRHAFERKQRANLAALAEALPGRREGGGRRGVFPSCLPLPLPLLPPFILFLFPLVPGGGAEVERMSSA